MKKTIFIILAIVLTASTGLFANNEKGEDKNTETSEAAPATSILTGTVVDQITGEALTGVKISIEGTNQVVYTDFDGNFSFQSVKPGQYNLKVDYISYKANSLQEVKVNGVANSIKIALNTVNK